jgi:GNAT superfamily N-acetyltransferase
MDRQGIEFHPLGPERWKDLVKLFGPRGACAGCWCMYPRLTTTEGKTSGEPNRRAFEKIVRQGPPPGLLAYENGEPVGWIAIAPRVEYRRFERSRVLAPVDTTPVWSVPCFFVARSARGRGLTVALLEAACEWARDRGAHVVEGYPVDTHGKREAAAFIFHGTVETFAAAGFREVLRRSDRRPIMRRTLRSVARGGAAKARATPARSSPRRRPGAAGPKSRG